MVVSQLSRGFLVERPRDVGNAERGQALRPVLHDGEFLLDKPPHHSLQVCGEGAGVVFRGVLWENVTGGVLDLQIPRCEEEVVGQAADVAPESPAVVLVEDADFSVYGVVVLSRRDDAPRRWCP